MADNLNQVKFITDYELVFVNILTGGLTYPITLKENLRELNYYEDIYSSTIYGELVLFDATNMISNLRLNGTEFIEFKIRKTRNDNDFVQRVFRVYKIGNRLTDYAKNQEAFVVYFCSEEMMLSEKYRISKSYKNAQISDIVEDVLINYLKLTPKSDKTTTQRTKGYQIEPTTGLYDFILPNKKILETIHWLTIYSRPITNPGADFVFYENSSGYNFVSLQTLFSKQTPFKSYVFNPNNITPELYAQSVNVTGFEVIKFFDTLAATSDGTFTNRLISIDPLTRTYNITDFMYDDYLQSAKLLNKAPVTTSMQNRWGDTIYHGPADTRLESGALRIAAGNALEKQIVMDPDSVANDIKIEDFVPNRVAQLGLMNYMKIKLTIPGDTQITVGILLNFTAFDLKPTVYSNADGQSSKSPDLFYSGNYLVTAVRHIMKNTEMTTVIEMVKDSFGTDSSAYLPSIPATGSGGFYNAINGIQ